MTELDALRQRLDRHPVQGSPKDMRAAFDALAPDCDAPQVETAGIPGRVFGNGDPVLWLHGGGYVFGSSRSHGASAAYLAQRARVCVVVPDYRLAPEHPWPAALEDVVKVLAHQSGPVGIVGDSAGGHLALALARRHPDRISRLALISPNTDRTGASETRAANSASDAMNDDETDAHLADLAFGDRAGDDPDVSPLRADLAGLPPTYLTVSTDEVLLDDSLLLARKLALAGVPVTMRVRRGLPHMWTLWPDLLQAARGTLDDIAAFLAGR